MNRRGFVAAIVAAVASVVSGKGRSFSPHKPRGRELVDAETPTRLSGLFRLNHDRRHPPGYEFYVDPKALRRWELHDDDYVYLANDATVDEGGRVVSWAPVLPQVDAFEAIGTFRSRVLP